MYVFMDVCMYRCVYVCVRAEDDVGGEDEGSEGHQEHAEELEQGIQGVRTYIHTYLHMCIDV